VYEDLMELAKQLATIDVGKPKQANLRRAVSTAYYSVFSFIDGWNRNDDCLWIEWRQP
jgi:hypothetical protein